MKLFLKIIGFLMLGFLVIALILYMNGVTHVDFDDRYYSFLLDINTKLSDWKEFKIPNIPEVEPIVEVPKDFWDNVANAVSSIANFLVKFLNLIINLINTAIEVIKFFVAIITVFFEDIPKIFRPSTENTPVLDSSMIIQ